MLNKQREYHSEFLLFYLRWSRSRTLTPAPTKRTGSATLKATGFFVYFTFLNVVSCLPFHLQIVKI